MCIWVVLGFIWLRLPVSTDSVLWPFLNMEMRKSVLELSFWGCRVTVRVEVFRVLCTPHCVYNAAFLQWMRKSGKTTCQSFLNKVLKIVTKMSWAVSMQLCAGVLDKLYSTITFLYFWILEYDPWDLKVVLPLISVVVDPCWNESAVTAACLTWVTAHNTPPFCENIHNPSVTALFFIMYLRTLFYFKYNVV